MIKYLNILSYFVIGEIFLTIFFEHLPFPFYSYNFWQITWLFSLIFIKPNLFLHKLSLISYIGLFFYAIQHFLIGKPEGQSFDFFQYYLFLISALTMFIYTISQKSNLHIVALSRFIIGILVFSALTSIIGFNLFPEAVRFNSDFIINQAAAKELSRFYASIGIMNYGFFYGISFLIPILFAWFRDRKRGKNIWLYYLAGIVIIYAVMKSNFATAFIITILGLAFSLIGNVKFHKYKILIIVLSSLLFFIPETFYFRIINSLTLYLEAGSKLQLRLNDLALTLQGQEDTHSYSRLDRIPDLINSFVQNPIWGTGYTTGHNFIFDILSCYGIIGLMPYLLFFYSMYKFLGTYLGEKYFFYYKISMLLFFFYSLVKGAPGKEIYLFIIFIIPIILFALEFLNIKRCASSSNRSDKST